MGLYYLAIPAVLALGAKTVDLLRFGQPQIWVIFVFYSPILHILRSLEDSDKIYSFFKPKFSLMAIGKNSTINLGLMFQKTLLIFLGLGK
jgi:hypothetical protein